MVGKKLPWVLLRLMHRRGPENSYEETRTVNLICRARVHHLGKKIDVSVVGKNEGRYIGKYDPFLLGRWVTHITGTATQRKKKGILRRELKKRTFFHRGMSRRAAGFSPARRRDRPYSFSGNRHRRREEAKRKSRTIYQLNTRLPKCRQSCKKGRRQKGI